MGAAATAARTRSATSAAAASARAGQQRRELLAADPREEVARPERARGAGRHRDEHRVAGGVAVARRSRA